LSTAEPAARAGGSGAGQALSQVALAVDEALGAPPARRLLVSPAPVKRVRDARAQRNEEDSER
jgi:hypothetical protein